MITFVHNLKCAGHSVLKWKEDNSLDFEAISRLESFEIDSTLSDSAYSPEWSFGIYRNTYDRLLSMYFFMTRKSGTIDKEGFSNSDKTFLDTVNSFTDFTSWFNYINDNYPAYFILQKDKLAGVDYVLDFDNLEADFVTVQEKFDCHEPLPLENKWSTSSEKETVVTPEVIDLIEDNFADDILHYGCENPYG